MHHNSKANQIRNVKKWPSPQNFPKKKKKHFAFGGKKKSRHGESGYGKGEEVEIGEEFWAVIDTAKKGEVMAISSDEKGARDSVKFSTTSKHDYHYG